MRHITLAAQVPHFSAGKSDLCRIAVNRALSFDCP